jgi:hypothetical protein
MKGCPPYRKALAVVGALLAGAVTVSNAAHTGNDFARHEQMVSDFERVDANTDGFISLAKFKAQKGDEQSFCAADLNLPEP